MATNEFFRVRLDSCPTIHASQDSNPQYAGQLKVGYTTRTARERLDNIYKSQSVTKCNRLKLTAADVGS